MKKYIITCVKEPHQRIATCDTKQEAIDKLNEYIEEQNEANCTDEEDEDWLCVFDFHLQEVDYSEPQEYIKNYEDARDFLGGKPNRDFTVSKKLQSGNPVSLEDVSCLVDEINPDHLKALIAFNRLATIAQAWNKADGFVPDFSSLSQDKWFPWFYYDKEAAGFVFAYTGYAPSHAYALLGSRLCFATRNRAAAFGKAFTHLYNEMFL